MKRKDLQEARQKTEKELLQLVFSKNKEEIKARQEMYAGTLKNLRKVRNLRRDIAQIKTVLKERSMNK